MTDVMDRTFGPGATDEDETTREPVLFRFELFEGLPVIGARIEVRNTAGGLNEAMDLDPVVLHQGDEFDITYRCKVIKIRHDPEDKNEPDGPQYRVHICDASRAVLVDKSLAQAEFERQAEQLAEREQIKGQQKLDVTEGESAPPGEQVAVEPPFLGYDDLPAGEIVTRIETSGDEDQDLVDAIEAYEEANGGRADILNAVKAWRDEGS